MRFMVLFIGSLLLLGIVLTGTVNCKSDNANPAAPGQTGANPGQEKKNLGVGESFSSSSTISSSSSTTQVTGSTKGLAGLENWLNQPDNYFPWYSSSGGSFYTNPYSDTTFSPFREYYTLSGTPVVGGLISNPTAFDIAQRTPSTIYYGNGQALPYSQYVSSVPSRINELWVQGATDWTQYVVCPVGTWLQLVANAPVGGSAGFYEMVQTSTTNSRYNTYQLNPGYNTMNFNADQVGRHVLLFVVNNQPSNAVIVDVFAQTPSTQY